MSGFSFDDPAVAYEAILPSFSSFKRPNEGGNVYVDGALKLDEWTAQDGTKRHGFACCPGTHAFSKSVAISRGAERIRVLWAGAKMAREVGAVDTIHRAFMQLVIDTDLIDGRGRWTGADVAEHVRRYGAEDVVHVIRWALRGWNPFEKGPLQ